MPATAIIQARVGSTRLPGKVLKDLAGHPMLWHVVTRVAAASRVERVVVATSEHPENDGVRALCAGAGVEVFSGSEEDVLDRYYRAARLHRADPVVRVTADCPLIDPQIIDRVVEMHERLALDYAATAVGADDRERGVRTFPRGVDVECISLTALERAWIDAASPDDREHVTRYVYGHPDVFICGFVEPAADLSGFRLTVDRPEDFELVELVFGALYREGEPHFGLDEVLEVLRQQPSWLALNRRHLDTEPWRGSVTEPAGRREA